MIIQNLQNLKLKKNVATYFLGSYNVPALYKLLGIERISSMPYLKDAQTRTQAQMHWYLHSITA